jgi:phosphonopyruvate decarboxylase
MQNSGLGNAINPLVSLTAPDVYCLPVLLIIGWRGEPGAKDEPQHARQGRITTRQLELLEIPYVVLDKDSDPSWTVNKVIKRIHHTNAPAALLVRKNTFAPYKNISRKSGLSSLTREDALTEILNLAGQESLVVSTTGKTSREVFEIRTQNRQAHRDFLTVGSMGHTASIALGVAMGNPRKRIICIDGDGSALMHLGALPVIGGVQPANLVYILLNNAAHESVGGQPTAADKLNFSAMARACGFRFYRQVNSIAGLKKNWAALSQTPGPQMIEVQICIGSRKNLGRPDRTPLENKNAFMESAID